MSNIYSVKISNGKLYLKINDNDNENYSRLGQMIFKLKDSNDNYITTGVSLSGVLNDNLYYVPNYNKLVLENWTVTKKAGTVTPKFTTNTWLEVLGIPENSKKIVIDSAYYDIFGHHNDTYWCYIEGDLPISIFSEPGISPTKIEIL
jgi:hypothetical protein